MPRVRYRRLLPPRLVHDEALPVVISDSSPSSSRQSRLWEALCLTVRPARHGESVQLAKEQWPNTTQLPKAQPSVICSINGCAADPDLALAKPGPHTLVMQRTRGAQLLEAPAPLWTRYWARQSRRLAVLSAYEVRRMQGRHFTRMMLDDEFATRKAMALCSSFPGGSFQAWLDTMRPDWGGPIDMLDFDALIWTRTYIEARLKQASNDLKNERRVFWQGRFSDDAKMHHKRNFRLFREPPLPEVAHVDRRDVLKTAYKVLPGQARFVCRSIPADVGPGSVTTFDTVAGVEERVVLDKVGLVLTFAKRIPQPCAGEKVSVHTKLCDIGKMHDHAIDVSQTITDRHSDPCPSTLDQVAMDLA